MRFFFATPIFNICVEKASRAEALLGRHVIPLPRLVQRAHAAMGWWSRHQVADSMSCDAFGWRSAPTPPDLPLCRSVLVNTVNASVVGVKPALSAAAQSNLPTVVTGILDASGRDRLARDTLLDSLGDQIVVAPRAHVLAQFGDVDKRSFEGTLSIPLRDYATRMRDGSHPAVAFDSASTSDRASLPSAVRSLLGLPAAAEAALAHFGGLDVLSLGADAEGVLMHSHALAWL